MKVVISSGHGKYIRGASGYIDEVDEARLVVDQVATTMRSAGANVTTFHDDVSTSQSQNLDRIVNFHNSQGAHDWDVSVHFNAYETTTKPMGCEVLYVSNTGEEKAVEVVDAICNAAPFINRGPKYRDGLAFLNGTNEPAVLIEVCFVDSKADVDIYRRDFGEICTAIAAGITGEDVAPGPIPPGPEPEPEPPPSGVLFQAEGTCSTFGGPEDMGVSASEGLAFIYDLTSAVQHLFLPFQPQGTTGLARRLNPYVHYIACRWDYNVTPKTMLRDSGQYALVTARKTGISLRAIPADWGPHEEQTGRAADLSPGLAMDLGVETDDIVEVIYPYDEGSV
jgi:N-acetylmuramoyl-L-alanine amidase